MILPGKMPEMVPREEVAVGQEIFFSLLLKSVFPGMGRKVSDCFVFGIYVTDVPKLYNFVFRVTWMQVCFFF